MTAPNDDGWFIQQFNILEDRVPPPPPVVYVAGCHPEFQEQIDAVHTADIFSFILEGSGWLYLDGQSWKIQSPCIFRHPQNTHISYGPDTSWLEVFAAYGDAQRELLEERGWWPEDAPVWSSKNDCGWIPITKALKELLQAPLSPSLRYTTSQLAAMALDIAASERRDVSGSSAAHENDDFARLMDKLRTEPFVEFDVDHLAAERNISPHHFRRKWRERFGTTPKTKPYIYAFRIR